MHEHTYARMHTNARTHALSYSFTNDHSLPPTPTSSHTHTHIHSLYVSVLCLSLIFSPTHALTHSLSTSLTHFLINAQKTFNAFRMQIHFNSRCLSMQANMSTHACTDSIRSLKFTFRKPITIITFVYVRLLLICLLLDI